MRKRKCKDCHEPAAALRPLWADPTVVLATSAYRVTVVNVPGGGSARLLPASPQRVALSVLLGSGGGANQRVWPALLPPVAGWLVSALSPSPWFNLFTHGAMVCDAWYASTSVTEPFHVVEWYMLEGR